MLLLLATRATGSSNFHDMWFDSCFCRRLEYGWNPSRNGLIKLHLSKYLDFHSFGMACFVTPVTPLYRLLVGSRNYWSQNTTQNTTTTNGFGIPVIPVVVSNWRDNQSIKLSTWTFLPQPPITNVDFVVSKLLDKSSTGYRYVSTLPVVLFTL